MTGTVDFQVTQVWEAWLARQARPHLCRLNKARIRAITIALEDYTQAAIVDLIRYVYESADPGPRWLRGENPDGVKYTDIESLLRPSKIAKRIEAAAEWVVAVESSDTGAPAGQSDVDVDALAALSRRRPSLGWE